MGLFLAVLIAFMALHSLWLNRLLGDSRHKKVRKLIEIMVIILVLGAVGLNYYRQREEVDEIKEQHQLLLSQNDSLRVQIGGMSEKMEPFLRMARSSYPTLRDEEALTKLATEISKMQPKLVFLGQTEPRRDSLSSLFHTVYGFRSEPTTGLSDVRIRISFDGRFVAINGRKRGDIVEGGGSMIIDPDSTGFYYTTRYLREGNDIKIEVISKSVLRILSMSLWPRPDK